jgi:hypothetical protein
MACIKKTPLHLAVAWMCCETDLGLKMVSGLCPYCAGQRLGEQGDYATLSHFCSSIVSRLRAMYPLFQASWIMLPQCSMLLMFCHRPVCFQLYFCRRIGQDGGCPSISRSLTHHVELFRLCGD